jgi:hypothetical protein
MKTRFKKEFQIYKAGKTENRVSILSKDGEPFDRDAKIKTYIELGYTVYDLTGKEIK